jgi:hypothetical protein
MSLNLILLAYLKSQNSALMACGAIEPDELLSMLEILTVFSQLCQMCGALALLVGLESSRWVMYVGITQVSLS